MLEANPSIEIQTRISSKIKIEIQADLVAGLRLDPGQENETSGKVVWLGLAALLVPQCLPVFFSFRFQS